MKLDKIMSSSKSELINMRNRAIVQVDDQAGYFTFYEIINFQSS